MKRRFIVTAIITAVIFIGIQAVRVAWASGEGSTSKRWSWSGDLQDEGWLNIRNANGAIRIVEGSGSEVQIEAVKQTRGGRAAPVSFVVNRTGDDVYVCAVNGTHATSRSCNEHRYRSGSISLWQRIFFKRTPSVTFTVHVPPTAQLNLQTVNGKIAVDASARAIVAETVNGAITTTRPVGAISAETVNGSIMAQLAAIGGLEDMRLETVNGSVTAELPDDIGLTIDASTVNGRVSSDLPITTSGKIEPKELRGTIGSGGPTLKLETVNGSISLRKAGWHVTPAQAPEPPTPPALPAVAGTPAPAPAPVPPPR